MKIPQALIVEDSDTQATIFTQALIAAGYKVSHVPDGIAAQAFLAEATPDLILVDVHLPYLTGDQLLKQLHQIPHFRETRIIVVTGNYRRAEELRNMADLVLHKPVSYKQLRDLSSRLLTIHKPIRTKPLNNP